jgi:hypothetical protein
LASLGFAALAVSPCRSMSQMLTHEHVD